jgi:hypothetical protein
VRTEEMAAEPGLDAVVLDAWRTVLGPEADAEEDFFDLGGNSLLALRVCHALRAAGLTVGVRDVYQHRTAVGLAAELRHRPDPGSSPSTARDLPRP